jgi:hypothetical protein
VNFCTAFCDVGAMFLRASPVPAQVTATGIISGVFSHGRQNHFHTPLCISLAILHTKQAGRHDNNSTAPGLLFGGCVVDRLQRKSLLVSVAAVLGMRAPQALLLAPKKYTVKIW